MVIFTSSIFFTDNPGSLQFLTSGNVNA